MSEIKNAESQNPTGESLDLDNALASLYEDSKDKESSDDTDVEDSDSDADEELGDDDTDAESSDDTDVEDSDSDADEELGDDTDADFSLDNHKNIPKEVRESLKDLDESIQKSVVDSYKKMHKNFSEKSRELSQSKQFSDSVEQAFKENGFDNAKVADKQKLIKNYVAFEKRLKTDPVTAVKHLMEYHKLTPEQLGINTSAANEKEAPSSDFDDDLLTDSERFLKKQIETQSGKITQLEQLLQQQSNRETQTAVERFASAENEDGELLHPHFDKVRQTMMDLADVNPKYTIKKLYNLAVRMDDDLYNETLETQKQKIINENNRKKKERLKKAKQMSKQSLKQNNAKTNESLTEEDALEKIAEAAGFN